MTSMNSGDRLRLDLPGDASEVVFQQEFFLAGKWLPAESPEVKSFLSPFYEMIEIFKGTDQEALLRQNLDRVFSALSRVSVSVSVPPEFFDSQDSVQGTVSPQSDRIDAIAGLVRRLSLQRDAGDRLSLSNVALKEMKIVPPPGF